MKNTEKEVYQRPEIEIILMDGGCDVIVTSGPTDTDDDWSLGDDGTQS